jgi:guanine nucleotide-binding protein G(i) subunit alpha
MGSCASVPDKAAQERSAEIDRQIEEDSRKFRKECKILLLGQYPNPRGSRIPPPPIAHVPPQALVNPERALSSNR